MRRAPAALVLVALATASPALAASSLDRAARVLRERSVTVHPQADPTLSAREKRSLEAMIEQMEAPVYIAVLPASAVREVDDVDALPRALYERVRRRGAYGVIAGRNFRAAASRDAGLDAGEAGRLATQAFHEYHPARNDGRVAPMLDRWASLVTEAMRDGQAEPEEQPIYRDEVQHEIPVAIEPGSFPLDRSPISSPAPFFGLASIVFVGVLVVGLMKALGGHGAGPPPVGGLFDDGPDPLGTGWREHRSLPRVQTHDPPRSSFDDDSGGGSWGTSSGDSSSDSSFDDDRDSGGGSW